MWSPSYNNAIYPVLIAVNHDSCQLALVWELCPYHDFDDFSHIYMNSVKENYSESDVTKFEINEQKGHNLNVIL